MGVVPFLIKSVLISTNSVTLTVEVYTLWHYHVTLNYSILDENQGTQVQHGMQHGIPTLGQSLQDRPPMQSVFLRTSNETVLKI